MEFYRNINEKCRQASLQKGLDSGDLTQDDVDLIKAFVNEKAAGWKEHRVQKSTIDLRQWRRFIPKPYRECSEDDIFAGINALKSGNSRKGTPFAENTLHDYIKVLKWFLTWGIENKRFKKIKISLVDKIKVPSQNSNTTTPDQLLTSEEIVQLIEAAKGDQYPVRDQAFIAVQFESGFRIGELARLKWKDVRETEYGYGLTIIDKKPKKSVTRYAGLVDSAPYLRDWKNAYPGRADPEKPVFISMWDRKQKGVEKEKEEGLIYTPMNYHQALAIVKRIGERAGLKKRLHCHLFRKSRITDMIRQNYQESVIKKSMWGNLDTKQFKTYAVLNEKDIDAEIMERTGRKPKENTAKENPLSPKICKWCKLENPSTNSFCATCGRPLTDDAMKAMEAKRLQVNQAILAMTPEERMEWMTEQLNDMKTLMAS